MMIPVSCIRQVRYYYYYYYYYFYPQYQGSRGVWKKIRRKCVGVTIIIIKLTCSFVPEVVVEWP